MRRECDQYDLEINTFTHKRTTTNTSPNFILMHRFLVHAFSAFEFVRFYSENGATKCTLFVRPDDVKNCNWTECCNKLSRSYMLKKWGQTKFEDKSSWVIEFSAGSRHARWQAVSHKASHSPPSPSVPHSFNLYLTKKQLIKNDRKCVLLTFVFCFMIADVHRVELPILCLFL